MGVSWRVKESCLDKSSKCAGVSGALQWQAEAHRGLDSCHCIEVISWFAWHGHWLVTREVNVNEAVWRGTGMLFFVLKHHSCQRQSMVIPLCVHPFASWTWSNTSVNQSSLSSGIYMAALFLVAYSIRAFVCLCLRVCALVLCVCFIWELSIW